VLRACFFCNVAQHGPPVFGAHRNDEFVEVVDEQVPGAVHQPIEAVVDGQDLAVVVDGAGDVRREVPRLDVDDAATDVLADAPVHPATDRAVVQLELLGAEDATHFDELHQVRDGVEAAEDRRDADAEVGSATGARVRPTVSGVGTASTEIDNAKQVPRTATRRRNYGHGKRLRCNNVSAVAIRRQVADVRDISASKWTQHHRRHNSTHSTVIGYLQFTIKQPAA